MKKILALALVLAMMLCSVSALAENTEEGFTVLAEVNVNEDFFASLLASKIGSVDEENMTIATNALKLINNLALGVSVGNNGGELDVVLNDALLAAIGLTATEDGGLALISDLVPNTVVIASPELIQQVMAMLQQQLSGLSGMSLDPEALAAAIMPHVQQLIDAFMDKIGEPENGLFTVDGYLFETKVPVNMNVKELALAILECVNGVMNEAEVQGLIGQIASMTGSYINLDMSAIEDAIADVEATPEDQLPDMELALYEGSAGEYIVLDLVREPESITLHFGAVNDVLILNLAAMDQVNVHGELTVDGDSGSVNGRIDVTAQGQYIGLELLAGPQDSLYAVELNLYFMDQENALAGLKFTVAPFAVFNLDFDLEGKSPIAVESLINEDSEALNALLMDLQIYGLPTVLQRATQAMPEEVSGLLQLVMGAQQSGF